jgi:hypothetical protein
MPYPLGFAEGEWELLNRARRGGGIFGDPSAASDPAGLGAPSGMPADTVQGGIFGKLANKLNQGVMNLQNNPTSQLGLRILANSGYSQQKRGLGEILGTSFIQNQEAGQQTQTDALRRRYMEAQIEALKRKPGQTPFADVNPSQYTPESVAAFQKSVAAGAPDYSLLQYNPKSSESPSNIREYEYYSKLTPEEKQAYLEMKRSVNPFTLGDLAGGQVAFDKRTGTYVPLTSASQEASGQATVAGAKSVATASGEQQGKAAFDLPRIEQNTQQALNDIAKLRSHPGLGYITGISSKLPIIPGTQQAAADALAKQIQGQTFLQAFNTLKGGGQITEVEGEKATAAIARLQRAQNTKDYQAALDDLSDVLNKGMQRARQQAGGMPQFGAPQSRQPAAQPKSDVAARAQGYY